MKLKLLRNTLIVATSLLIPAVGSARNKSADVRTLTGCLSRGDSGHEYRLTTENGSTWELRSETVKLSRHAGHFVTVTGRVRAADLHGAKEKVKDEMKEHGVDKESTEHGHLKVTHISMVSETCKR